MRSASLAWAIVGLFFALLAQVALETLWILAFVPVLLWAVAGLAIFVVALWRARDPERRRGQLLFALGAVLGLFLFFPIAKIGNSITTRVRFSLQRTAYDQVVARERATTPEAGLRESSGMRYVVDTGPPMRIAFIWPGGIIDNWCGAVYDPTGVVMRSSDFNGDWETWYDQVSSDIINLFGGDLLHCEELDAPYYHCCFT